MEHSCPLWTGIPTQLALGVGVKFVPKTWLVTSVNWSPAQWELFAQKRSYKECKKFRPSSSVPPVTGASPRAGTPLGVPQPGTSSSYFSCPSGGQDKRGLVSGCTWCCVP